MADETIRIIIDGQDNASSAFRSAGSGLSSLGQIAGSILAARLLERIAEGLADIAKKGFEAVSDYQRIGLAFEAMTAKEIMAAGGADTMAEALVAAVSPANELLQWATQMALASPFAEEDVQYVLRISMAYGMSSEMAKGLVTALTNLSGATGLSGNQMQLLGLALGQVWAKGKLTGEEMRQLTNAGVGVDMIARAMGISVSQVAAAIEGGKISAQELIPALIEIINTDFAGAGERMAFSWAGFSSTMGDVGTIALRTLLIPAFEVLEPYMQQFLAWIMDPALREQLTVLGERIGVWLAGAIQTVTGIVQWAVEHWDMLKGALAGVGAAFGGLLVISIITGLISALASPITLIIGAAALLGVAWKENWGGIQEITAKVWAKLQEIFEMLRAGWEYLWNEVTRILEPILDDLLPLLKSIAADAVAFFNAEFDKITTWVKTNWPLIRQTITTVLEAIKTVWDAVWPHLREVVLTIWENIKIAVDMAINTVLGIIRAVMLAINGDWEGAWTQIKDVAIGLLIGTWTMIQRILNTILGFFGTNLDKAWATTKTWIGKMSGSISDFFTVKIPGFFDGLVSSITGFADKIVSAIESPFKTAWEWLSGLWEDIKYGVSHLFDNVHIPLPHFSVNWTEVLGVRIPSGVSVQWYGSGLDAIFNSPTLIGVGERGAERVQVTPMGKEGANSSGDTWNINVYPQGSEVRSLRDLLTALQMARA